MDQRWQTRAASGALSPLMATVFSHALVGCTLVSTLSIEYRTKSIYFLAGLTAIAPDFDYFGLVARIPYESPWGHRGMTHSIVFAVVMGVTLAAVHQRRINFQMLMLSFLFFSTTISHALIDACTNGGLGVAFYAPYNNLRYFFPWRPIQVSPMGLNFFSERGLVVLMSEAYWILSPCLLIYFVTRMIRTKAVHNDHVSK